MAQLKEVGSSFPTQGDTLDDIPFIDADPSHDSPAPQHGEPSMNFAFLESPAPQHGEPSMNFAFLESPASSRETAPHASPTELQSEMLINASGEAVASGGMLSAAEAAAQGTDPAIDAPMGKSGFFRNSAGSPPENGTTPTSEGRERREKRSRKDSSSGGISRSEKDVACANGDPVQRTAAAARAFDDVSVITTQSPEAETASRAWSTSSSPYPDAVRSAPAGSSDSVFVAISERPDLAKNLMEKLVVPHDPDGAAPADHSPRANREADDKGSHHSTRTALAPPDERTTRSCSSSGSEVELRIIEDGDPRPSLSRQSSVPSSGSEKKKLYRRVSFNDKDFSDRMKQASGGGGLGSSDRSKHASSGSLGNNDRTRRASGSDRSKHASSSSLGNKETVKQKLEDYRGRRFDRTVSEIPLCTQHQEPGLSEEARISGGGASSYRRKAYSDTFLNEEGRDGAQPAVQEKPRNGKLARKGALKHPKSDTRTVSEQSLGTDVPVEEDEEEERAGRDFARTESDSSYKRGPDEGENSPGVPTEDSEEDTTESEAESEAEKKSLPMFFVGTDADPSRQNGYPSEAPLLTKHENGISEANGTHGESNEVTMRHPPKNQNSALLSSLFMILSGLYGILVVVLGAVIPLTEIFVSGDRTVAFEYFYIYLYGTSIIFLCYVYVYLLRRKRLQTEFIARTLSRSVSFTRGFATSFLQRQNSDKSRQRKRMVSLDESNHHTGTFYLRLGVLGFGIGSMIHSGLNFGKFFGSITEGQCSSGASLLLKPLLHLIFTFSQLYFIFMNSKMCIHRYKVIARFGLMHMAATNICVWFRSIVVETLHEIHHLHAHHAQHDDQHGDDLNHLTQSHRTTEHHHAASGLDWHGQEAGGKRDNVSAAVSGIGRKLLAAVASAANGSENPGGMMELRCSWNNMMGKAVDAAGPYLYPCTIEYSLMCAGILYVMWNNVGTRPRRRTTSEIEDEEDELKHQRMSVDCTSSSRGLFLGIFLTVCAIISIIAFYFMVGQPHLRSQALLLTHLSETIIYCVTLFALVMATLKMRHLVFHSDHASDLEETLIIIAYTGLMAFNIFSLIAAILMAPAEGAALTIMSNFTMMLQSALQTIFMLAGDRMSAGNSIQERKKPGREYVTFLLLCNFAMWIINTFETQKSEHNPLQVGFYGPDAWSIFSHISVPLGIYYRFHSTVCLSNIWKNAWKFRKHH